MERLDATTEPARERTDSRRGTADLPAHILEAGECGLICLIDGDHEDIERLKVMGVCLGRRLHVIKAGDPMIVSVMGTRLGIAKRLAEHVFVRRDVEQHCREGEGAA